MGIKGRTNAGLGDNLVHTMIMEIHLASKKVCIDMIYEPYNSKLRMYCMLCTPCSKFIFEKEKASKKWELECSLQHLQPTACNFSCQYLLHSALYNLCCTLHNSHLTSFLPLPSCKIKTSRERERWQERRANRLLCSSSP